MRLGHWYARRSSFLGHRHVAGQALGAALRYYAAFVLRATTYSSSVTSSWHVAGGWYPLGRACPLSPSRPVSPLYWRHGGACLLDFDAIIPTL